MVKIPRCRLAFKIKEGYTGLDLGWGGPRFWERKEGTRTVGLARSKEEWAERASLRCE